MPKSRVRSRGCRRLFTFFVVVVVSGLGVPSTLLVIFWAGLSLPSMPNSGLGAMPGKSSGGGRSDTLNHCVGLARRRRGREGGPPDEPLAAFYVQRKVGSPSQLTRGVVGHVAPHGVGPSLVHHALHAVHARPVGGASAHHTLGHVGVARRPGGRTTTIITTTENGAVFSN